MERVYCRAAEASKKDGWVRHQTPSDTLLRRKKMECGQYFKLKTWQVYILKANEIPLQFPRQSFLFFGERPSIYPRRV